jgi:uncharacterized protein YjbI with pentapeptide repeats
MVFLATAAAALSVAVGVMLWLITDSVTLSTCVVLILWCAWWICWDLPRLQVDNLSIKIYDPKARADAENDFRQTIGRLFGGLAVLLGAGAAYLQFGQQKLSAHEDLINKQMTTGFEQISHTERYVRVGGIYGLMAVIDGSAEFHLPIFETLCMFVREQTKGDAAKAKEPPDIDVQAALKVIGTPRAENGRCDLTGVQLPKLILTDAYLTDVDLSDAYLPGAFLSNGHLANAKLNRARLPGVHLDGANLRDATLVAATLSPDAHLANAHLNGAHLNGANLSGADLTGADLTGADLTAAILINATVSSKQLEAACGVETVLPAGLPTGFALRKCAPKLRSGAGG